MTIRSARNPIVFSPYWGGDYVGLSGSARTLDPTNKNYAPELSTFGAIIEVNRSEVQWTSLSLEKLPSWSQLISAPGKYELAVRDFSLWTLCLNCEGPGLGEVDRLTLYLPGRGFGYQIKPFCWSKKCNFSHWFLAWLCVLSLKVSFWQKSLAIGSLLVLLQNKVGKSS